MERCNAKLQRECIVCIGVGYIDLALHSSSTAKVVSGGQESALLQLVNRKSAADEV